MPRKGYECVTVTDRIHEEIKQKAEENNSTMRQYVEDLRAKDKVAEKEGT